MHEAISISCAIDTMRYAWNFTETTASRQYFFFDICDIRYLVTEDPKGILAESHRGRFQTEITDIKGELLWVARHFPQRIIDYFAYGRNEEIRLPRIVISDYELVLR